MVSAAVAAPNTFTAALTPGVVTPTTQATYTLTLTNGGSSGDVGAAKVAIPTGFTQITGVTANATAAANCGASTWEADGDLLANGKINLKRPGGGGNLNLCPGATLTIAFTAVSPATEGPYTWTPELLGDSEEPYTFSGDPTVHVDGTAPETTITSAPPAATSQTSASFTFGSEEGATFQCRLDGAAFADCVSPTNYTDLGESPHVFEVRATDAAGNSDASPASHSWTIDLTAPQTTIDSGPPTPTKQTSASFTFSSEPGTTFQCSLDGEAFTACTSPMNHTGLSENPHTFEVQATDPAGNTDPTPASHSWTVDLTAPQTTIDSGPPTPTKQTSASFTFSSEPGTTFQCSLDGEAFTACTSPMNHTGLSENPHTFEVQATDPAGNTDPTPASHSWTVDLTAPQTTIGPGPPTPTKQTSASFTFSSEPETTFECSLDSIAAGAFAPCTSPKVYTGIAPGARTFRVRATDPAGNVDLTPAAHNWTIDTAAPETTVTSPGPATPTNQTSASFTFGSSEAGSTFECSLDAVNDGAFAPCTSPTPYTGLPEGPRRFRVRATDPAGNVDATPAERNWTIDTTSPTVAIVGDKPGDPTSSKSATFTFTSSEPSTIQCRLDAGAFAPCSGSVTYTNLSDAQHTFIVRATDAAGNAGQASHTWTVDSAAPTVAIGDRPANATKSRSATFSFTASEPTQCKLDSGAFGACASPTAYADLPDGLHTFTVKATDAAGNTGQDVYVWTIDNVAPTVTIVQKPTNPSDVKSPTFAFSVNEGGTVECKLDNGAFSACASPKNYPNLTDGEHVFTVRATDAAGNTGQDTYQWRLETALPVATLVDAPQNPSTSTLARFDFASRPQATFECSLDGGAFAACPSPQEYTGLAQGTHTFAVRAKDAAGTGPATSYAWQIDSVGPTALITETPGNPTSSRSATFAFSANEPGSFACELDGGGFGPCASPWSYQGLGDGAHTFTVRPTDFLGNTGASATYSWRVDATAPETTLGSAPASRTTSVSATFSFSANEPAGFECKLDAGAFAPCGSPKTHTGLTRAAHSFEVRAIDAAGNVDATPAVHRWTVTAPAARRTSRTTSALLSPRAGARVTSPPLLRWRRVARASYYNVQLFRGSVKILSAWPAATRLQLKARWRYLGRQRRLSAGVYRWYVWPGYGKASQRRYGRMLGGSTFRVVSRARR